MTDRGAGLLDWEVYENPSAQLTSTYNDVYLRTRKAGHSDTDAQLLAYSRVGAIELYTSETRLYNFATRSLPTR